MANATQLLAQGNRQEIWRRYCGFLDLGMEEFMAVQRRLLEEQLPRLASCELGRAIMKGAAPRSLEEFREKVPFTTYRDYTRFLSSRAEEALPQKPFTWAHTSGKSGEYEMKWVPYTRRMYELGGENGLGMFLIASSKKRGDVVLRRGMKFPYIVAPPPYVSGLFTQSLLEQFDFTSFPPLDRATTTDFQQRLQEAFGSALSEGLDFFYGVTSILLRISEKFSFTAMTDTSLGKMALKPRAVLRLLKALIKAAVHGRPLQPRDIWNVKGALCGGSDTSIFKNKVAASWGIRPIEGYASTEFGAIATQSWSREGLTFFPEGNLWEFILEKDYKALVRDPSAMPRSCLLNEVLPGTEYVLVGTNFHGGALVRYIVGDLVKIVSLEDQAGGIHLPQMSFVSRIDDVIDVGGFTRLTEKTVWQALENSGVPYDDWTIRKEPRGERPILHLYLEPRGAPEPLYIIEAKIHEHLKKLDAPYKDLEDITGMKPLMVTLLSKGTFQRYYEERQAAGADLAHLKPPHISASDKIVENLHRMSAWKI